MFGATLGTGVGGGIAIDGRVHSGANGAAAEWSHTTLPFLRPGEASPYACFCGHAGCIESFTSGRGLAGAYREVSGLELDAPEVGARAAAGDDAAARAFDIYEDRLARALAGVINLLDPRAIVLGGGVSNNTRIFAGVRSVWEQYTVAKDLRDASSSAPSTATPAVSAAPPGSGRPEKEKPAEPKLDGPLIRGAAPTRRRRGGRRGGTGGDTIGGCGISSPSSSSTCTERRL